MESYSPEARLEVFYQERALTQVEAILKSPDRSPNFRGAVEMGIGSKGGFERLLDGLLQGKFRGAYIVGEDLFSASSNDGARLRGALEGLSFLVVQDTHLTPTAKMAHVVLPSTHFAEKEGTYTNRKGRVQKLNPALVPPSGALQDWEIFGRLLARAGGKVAYRSPGEIFLRIAAEVPRYRGLTYERIGAHGMEPEGPADTK